MATNQAVRRTLGPVLDLERDLPADWWRTPVSALYLETEGDVVENDENTAAEVDVLVHRAGLDQDSRILDLRCGQGRHVLELARRGFAHVAGLDRSRSLIRLARSRARKEGHDVRFHEGDARRFRLPRHSFDCVAILGNSSGYFERESDDLDILRASARVLRPGGTLVLDVADGDRLRKHFEPWSWDWIDADQFYAERLYDRLSIERLLRRAGYRDVETSEGAETPADRKQDLGRMAQRLWVRAVSLQESSKARIPRIYFPAVTVLLGDPSLPEPVKHGGRCSAEDLETVSRMRDAVQSLEGYRSESIDRHADLTDVLSRRPPEFVLDLCGEGFGNDALKELCVPALLELLGVPYSGAAPTVLGLCYGKAKVAAIARSLEVAVPEQTLFESGDRGATLPSVFPALVKPVCSDSSIGISADLRLLFQELVCHDYARFDFSADAEGRPKLLEVDPKPGWCWYGKLDPMAELEGWCYAELSRWITVGARERMNAARERRSPCASLNVSEGTSAGAPLYAAATRGGRS